MPEPSRKGRYAMRVILITTAALIFAACGGGVSSSPSQSTPTAPTTSNSPETGALGGTVTVNGEAFPLAWLETEGGWGFATTMPGGSWEWVRMPPGAWVVVIKTPPGVTCDAKRKSATVVRNERTLVTFACFGAVKGSIVGLATNEFGTAASIRLTLTGPVSRETISNQDGFFAFDDLPPGEYSIRWCTAVSASVRDGATAFVNVDCS
jgi:hypothetical protein